MIHHIILILHRRRTSHAQFIQNQPQLRPICNISICHLRYSLSWSAIVSCHLSGIEHDHIWSGVISPTPALVCHPVEFVFSYYGLQTPQKSICCLVRFSGYFNFVSRRNFGARPAGRILRTRFNVNWCISYSRGSRT